jgi:hypothetical protein
MIVFVIRLLKRTFLPVFLFLLTASCSSNDVASPYLAARPFQQYAAKADAWLLQAQQSSGMLHYIYRPSVARAIAKNRPMGQLMAAEHLARLGQARPKVRTASEAQQNAVITLWPYLSQKFPEGTSTQVTLGEFALWLRVLLLQPNPVEAQGPLNRQAMTLQDSFNAETGFPEKLFPATTDSLFMQRYFTGHAALSLLRHSAAMNDARSLSIADAALHWLETQYPTSDKDHFHPTLAPWHALAIAAQYKLTNTSPHLDTLFAIADQLIDLQSDPEFPGRFFTEKGTDFGKPNVVRDALSTLTLMASLDIAIDLGNRKRQKQYRKAIWLGLDNLRSLQYDHGVVTNFDQPMKAVGALRFRHNDEMIRLDGVVFGAEVFERAAIMIQNGRL